MTKLQVSAALAALGLAGAAIAQSPPPADSPPPEQRPATQRPQPEQPGGGSAGGAFKMSDQHRTSKIVGQEVQTPTGDSLGKVEELVLDRTGQVTHAIISYGGTFGMGEKFTAVPWQVFSSKLAGDKVVLEEQLVKQAPSFNEGKWPDLTSKTWSQQMDRFWSQQAGGGQQQTPMRSATAPTSTPEAAGSGTRPQQSSPPPQSPPPQSSPQQMPSQQQAPQEQAPQEQQTLPERQPSPPPSSATTAPPPPGGG